MGVIRDDEQQRRARIEEVLRQLQQQAVEMQRLWDESAKQVKMSQQLRTRSASLTNGKRK